MDNQAMNIDYKALASALLQEQGTRFKAVVPSTPTGTNSHGPGGLFSSFGLSKPLFSAMLLPQFGIASRLPVRFNNETNPLYGIITGVTSSTGSEPTGVCDDPPYAGVMKLCTHSFVFGRYSRMTKVFDIESAGQTINRGEFTDLEIFGGTNPESPFIPTMAANPTMSQAAARTAMKALFELGVAWTRDFARQIYTGNPTNNTAGGGYKEFYGFDLLINTGYRDAETGVACAAADSTVRSFGNLEVKTNSAKIVREITYIFRNLKYLARHAGLDPVRWAMAMPFGLFYELSEIWPISYSTTAATVIPAGATLNVDARVQIGERDLMRGNLQNYTGQYLLVDGEKVDVIIDDAIPETQNAGSSFDADIYFIPLTVLGGNPVTYLEHFNYDGPGAASEMAQFLAPAGSFYTSDGGRFLWHKKPPTNVCVQVVSYTRPRLLLLTPYLAARLTDIHYTPLYHERAWDNTDPSFFVNGGRTAGDTTDPSYFSPTA